MPPRTRILHTYVAAVTCAAGAVLVPVLATPWAEHVRRRPVALALLTALVVLGELRPITIIRNGEHHSVTPSTTFAFASLLALGTAPAIAVLGLACLVADAFHRAGLLKTTFNVAQYTLSLAGAGILLRWTGTARPFADGSLSATELAAMLGAAAIFFVINNTLVGVVGALAHGRPARAQVIRALRLEVTTAGALLGLAPVACLVVELMPLLLPLLLLPTVAVYASAKSAAEQEHQARHDALTGLPNRMRFLARVEEAIAQASPEEGRLAVMLMDLDRFKDINDTLGHHTGDELLRELARRLEGIDGLDTVARLGGDEFALLVSVADVAQARRMAERLLAAIRRPVPVSDLSLDVEASVGIALWPDHGADADTLLQRADVAMYLVKDTHTHCDVYTPDRDPHSTRRLRLLGELRQALAQGELRLLYQPQVDLSTGEVVAVEGLVRWFHPTLGMVPPSEFVPGAERSGLIEPLTRFVLEEGVRQCRAWLDEGLRLRVSINLSARNVHDVGLGAEVAALLDRYRVDPSLLCLEITETAIMDDPVRARAVLDRVSSLGVRLAIDDFGTGYSSLAQLRRLPVSEIKIDRSFVAGMAHGDGEVIIVRSTIDLARNLGLEATAEGVESEEMGAVLAGLGCHLGQGYHYGRPVPADVLSRQVARPPLAAATPGEPGVAPC